MTRQEFEQLPEARQLEILTTYGVFLVERTTGGNRIYLYAISSFYIELFHELSNIRNTAIRILKVFDDVRYLDAYLPAVDISDLEQCK